MISLKTARHTSANAKPWQLKPSSRSDERLRFWPSAMPGSRCVTRFLHTKLSPPRKMLLSEL